MCMVMRQRQMQLQKVGHEKGTATRGPTGAAPPRGRKGKGRLVMGAGAEGALGGRRQLKRRS